MKIDTLERLNKHIKAQMDCFDIKYSTFQIWQPLGQDQLLVSIDAPDLPVSFIVFIGNCLKKYQDNVLYSEAVL